MTSKLWQPIQEHINSIDGAMPCVHHYTSLKGALGILQSGRIWFTERAHLNDPSEISYGIQIAQALLRKQGRAHDANYLANCAERVFHAFRFFSASFSFAYQETFQWMEYADGGKGVLLSFKPSIFNCPKAFIDTLILGNPTAVVCPMSYDSGRLKSVIASIVEHWDGHNADELSDHIFMISGMFKDDRRRWEKEYRFFVHHKYAEVIKSVYYKTRKRINQTIPYLDLPIQGWNSPDELPVYRVCCGPHAPPETEAKLAELMRAMKPPPREGILRSGPKGF